MKLIYSFLAIVIVGTGIIICLLEWYYRHIKKTSGCPYIKREGQSCSLNNNCNFPNCKPIQKNLTK